MMLYVKEVVSPERIMLVMNNLETPPALPADTEQALYLWISCTCALLSQKAQREVADNPDVSPKY